MNGKLGYAQRLEIAANITLVVTLKWLAQAVRLLIFPTSYSWAFFGNFPLYMA